MLKDNKSNTVGFRDLIIDKRIHKALMNMGFEEPSPIQSKAVPVIMQGKDVLGQAQTGTGKTAAFAIPTLHNIDTNLYTLQAIVIVPTRELAIQVSEEIAKIGRFIKIKTLPIYGGQSIDRQIKTLKRGVHIVVGTPGRLLDHLRRKTLNLHNIKVAVLDEADEMLDMGFIDDITTILEAIPDKHQTLMFSATILDDIKKLAGKHMKNPVHITVSKQNLTVPNIEQLYCEASEDTKIGVLCGLLDNMDVKQAIIFCRTKRRVDQLATALKARGFNAEGLHGDMSQYIRNSVMKDFKKMKVELLVATDVAARGLDVENVSHVINFDIPQDPEFYIHRIGRTGRAGRDGVAITIIDPKDYKQLRSIERVTSSKLKRMQSPITSEVKEILENNAATYVQKIINTSDIREYHPIAAKILEVNKPLEAVSALLYVLNKIKPAVRNTAKTISHDTGATKGMVRLFFTVGRKENISAESLKNIIAKETTIDSNAIKNTRIYDNFSFVEVPEEWCNCVLNMMNKQVVGGRRISVQLAKKRD